MALTKHGIVDHIQDQLGYQRSESGEDVLVSGFGKFCVKDKAERKGRNPATGETLMLKPRRVVTFQCSGKLRDKINGK